MPDYETTTLSGTMAGVAWTFQTGRVVVPSSGSTYLYDMTSDNLYLYWNVQQSKNISF